MTADERAAMEAWPSMQIGADGGKMVDVGCDENGCHVFELKREEGFKLLLDREHALELVGNEAAHAMLFKLMCGEDPEGDGDD